MKIYLKKGKNWNKYPPQRKTFGTFIEHISKKEYKAYVYIGHQYFRIGEGDYEHCEWAVKMFRKALRKHNQNIKPIKQ